MSEHVTVRQLSHATQQVQAWLNDLSRRQPFENQEQAYSYLRAVLHAIRDRLTPEEVAHVGSQLPMIVRGFYFEGWRPVLAPNEFATRAELYDRVRESLGSTQGPETLDVEEATGTVIDFLADHLDEGLLRHVTSQLPGNIATLFPVAVQAR
jgi:uncharacterized protein (DUF2267 family)